MAIETRNMEIKNHIMEIEKLVMEIEVATEIEIIMKTEITPIKEKGLEKETVMGTEMWTLVTEVAGKGLKGALGEGEGEGVEEGASLGMRPMKALESLLRRVNGQPSLTGKVVLVGFKEHMKRTGPKLIVNTAEAQEGIQNRIKALFLGKTKVQDLNVTVTGDRRSFNKEVKPTGETGRREQHGPAPKHQPSLPPRLQQQQERNKRQKQQQQQQQVQQQAVEKQDPSASRSNKRYSSQRQRPAQEGAAFVDQPQISQPPSTQQQHAPHAGLPQQYRPNFSPPVSIPQQGVVMRPAISPQRSGEFVQIISAISPQRNGELAQQEDLMRPAISPQRNVGPAHVQSPTMSLSRGPPPPAMIPVPLAVPRPPPTAQPAFIRGPPPPGAVFAGPPGTLTTTAVIGTPTQIISPAGIPSAAVIYAAPPPPFQVPVPQFTQSNPGETISGGTTYYSNTSSSGGGASTGTIYYPPEMQVAKSHRVQVRRPKAPLPIINPEEVQKNINYQRGEEEYIRQSDDTSAEEEQILEIDDTIEQTENMPEEPYEEHDYHNVQVEETEEVDDEIEDVRDESKKDKDASIEVVDVPDDVDQEEEYDMQKRIGEMGFSAENAEKEADDFESIVHVVTDNADSVKEDAGEVDAEKEENIDNTDETQIEEAYTAGDQDVESNVEDDISQKKTDFMDTNTDTVASDERKGETFVIKAEALTPTLSVSASVLPEQDSKDPADKIVDNNDETTETKDVKQEEEPLSDSKGTVAEDGSESKDVKKDAKSKDGNDEDKGDDDEDEFVDTNENLEGT
ncbi:hypothetical protein MAR_034696 [Mya arenaria]|uniref:Uncharacterized protein n=1 Tax=Mya arenaria TaxID=6604 RepID=A0ABY7EHZ6_MYAAR|nr:hypothetical protein MAR_034696 [Mya arenaria]